MPRKKRPFTTFSLSFLDIMSCGFGAVALIFLIIKHDTNNHIDDVNQELLGEVSLLAEDIRDGEAQLVRARNTVSELDQQLVEANGLASRINEDITAIDDKIRVLDDKGVDQQIADVREQLETARLERERLAEEDIERGNDVRRFVGEGQRQYLTGLKLGGARILILIDASTSMLDEKLVNIIRKRNMSDAVKQSSPKWLQAVTTVKWLTAQLPKESNYQLYTFNTGFKSTISSTENQWLKIGNGAQLEQAVLNLQKVVPSGGTSLENVFASIAAFEQPPDNIYLITDGLPTQGKTTPKSGTISGEERRKLFGEAVKVIPRGIPINVILLPMEGDWMAAAELWHLAQMSGGSFLSPSKDWP